MNEFVESTRFTVVMRLLIIGLVLIAGVAMGPLVQNLHVGVREVVIVTLAVLMATLVFVPSERILRFGFTLWILTFALGWRTIYLTPELSIHPAEVLVTLLFFASFAYSIIRQTRLDFSIPPVLPVFMLFVILGALTAIQGGTPFAWWMVEFKPFFEIILVYYVVKWMVRTRQDWERAAVWTIVVATYIAGLGLLDYFAPGVSRTLSGQQNIDPIFLSQSFGGSTFSRVGFILFGNFTAGFVIFTFTGFTIYHLLENWKVGYEIPKRILLVGILLVQMMGIYLSGYRGLWYATGVFLAIYMLLRRRAVVLILALLVGIPFLPSDFLNRFQSIFNTEYADSSQYDRIARASTALNQFQQSPLAGVGWGGSGYVHSDLIQIAANLGMFGILFFLLWIATLLYRLIQTTRSPDWAGSYATVLFPMVCAIVVLLAGEGLAQFVQLIMPVWFLFAMCHKLSELASNPEAT